MKISFLDASTLTRRLKKRRAKARSPEKAGESSLEAEFEQRWKALYPDLTLEREVRFHDVRRFRFDFCHRGAKVGIEIQGGIWGKGGHSSGQGITRDCEKSNLAQSSGWVIFALTDAMSRDAATLQGIAEMIHRRSV